MADGSRSDRSLPLDSSDAPRPGEQFTTVESPNVRLVAEWLLRLSWLDKPTEYLVRTEDGSLWLLTAVIQDDGPPWAGVPFELGDGDD